MASIAGARTRLTGMLPKGTPLSDDLFASRHRVVLVLLWAHTIGLAAFGVTRGFPPWHLGLELAGLVLVVIAATLASGRELRAGLGTLGLVTCSALLVHLSGGLIEAHFHFFIVVILVTLYQSWVPFLLAMLFVVVHHGTVGVLDPGSVYNHQAAIERPWLWAGIHGLFVTGAAIAALAAWKHVEIERERAEESAVRLHDRTLRHREAMELNDTVVQALVAAKYAAQLGRHEVAADTVERTLERAQRLVADLMQDDGERFDPGSLRRVAPAQAASV
jgi:signal transduction histidine kinase